LTATSNTVSVAEFQAALSSVTYSSASDNPTAISTTRDFNWDVTDYDSSSQKTSAVVSSLVSIDSAIQKNPIDGVIVTQQATTLPDGRSGIQTTIPVITSERIQTIGNNTVADIPLVTENGSTLLLAQLP
jgi:hypothetical protein